MMRNVQLMAFDDPHCPLKTHAKDHKGRGGET